MRKFNTKGIAFLAMLAAISVILGAFKISIGDSLRITFMNIPIILTSLWFGPFAGIAVGLIADFLSANLTTGWFPPLALTPVLFGVIPAMLNRFLKRRKGFIRLFAIILLTNFLGTMLWSTYALTLLLGTEYFPLLVLRVPLYLGIAVLETICIFYISKSGLEKMVIGNRTKWWFK